MRTSMAYFAGAGTVIGAIVLGLGGGLLVANMVNPPAKQGTEMSLMERRKASEPVLVKIGASDPVQYLAAPQLSPPNATVATVPPQAATPTEPVNAAATPAAVAAAAPAAQPAAAPTAEPAAPTAREPRRVASEDAFAKAQEADLKRDAEVRRLVEKRKAERERRQQWTEKRRSQPGESRDLHEFEEAVRDETEPRRERVLAAEPARNQMPLIKLFGSE